MDDMTLYVKAAAYLGAALVVGLGTIGPALGQGMVASRACENIGKYPESSDKIRTVMLLGLTFIETSSIYALLIALILLFFKS